MSKTFVQPGYFVDLLESDLTHPSHTTGLVQSGDAVLCGRLCGVSEIGALAATDTIPVAVQGVHNVSVTSTANGVAKGETVYIDPSTAVVNEDLTAIPFGTALAAVSFGNTTVIPVRLFGSTPGAIGAHS